MGQTYRYTLRWLARMNILGWGKCKILGSVWDTQSQFVIFFPNETEIDKNYWDKISLGMVKESQEASKSSEVAAVLMEEGQANLYSIKNNFSIHKGCVQKS